MDNTATVKEKKKLPARKIVLIVIMSVIMAITFAFFVWDIVDTIHLTNIGSNETYLGVFFVLISIGLLIVEGTQFFDIFYFISDKKKKYKTVLNAISLSAALVEVLMILLLAFFAILHVSTVAEFFLLASIYGLYAVTPAIVFIKIAYLIAHLIGKNNKK